MSETEKKKAPGYTVMVMDETSDYELRTEAVTAAKEASNAGARRVEIQDGAKRELLTYRDGRLVEYVYESRGLRRDRPPREERPPREQDGSPAPSGGSAPSDGGPGASAPGDSAPGDSAPAKTD